ncbi:amidohydrolase [Pseudomonas sp. M30-35]|uniref:amidohydrolase n=1 Tax=Pseudomonas sp. M30-35 TaxID=1981174 RepID=UPI000B3CF697|nr:amidohydrolase [Pseudomonas sp. M30-35]ARU87650.1 amidohydrolase [Pseudomonas sp. M30-35]
MRDLTTLPDLNLALVQSDLVWQDPAANREHFEQLLASVEGVDLVVLPEMFSTGFSMDSAKLAEPEGGPSSQWLVEQAVRMNAVVTGSLIIQASDGSYRNRLIWARPDGSVAHYDKRHLFRMAGEHKHFAAGQQQALFSLKGWNIRPLICYDLRFPVWSRDATDTDLLLYTANWPAARRNHWNRLLPARAIENLCFVAAVNRTGTDGKGHAYSGDSKVIDFQGEVLLESADVTGVYCVTLKGGDLAEYRQRFPADRDADTFTLG